MGDNIWPYCKWKRTRDKHLKDIFSGMVSVEFSELNLENNNHSDVILISKRVVKHYSRWGLLGIGSRASGQPGVSGSVVLLGYGLKCLQFV